MKNVLTLGPRAPESPFSPRSPLPQGKEKPQLVVGPMVQKYLKSKDIFKLCRSTSDMTSDMEITARRTITRGIANASLKCTVNPPFRWQSVLEYRNSLLRDFQKQGKWFLWYPKSAFTSQTEPYFSFYMKRFGAKENRTNHWVVCFLRGKKKEKVCR